MQNESITKKLLRNSLAGIIAFGVQIIVTFISRVVFIRYLGIEYLGVNDLYTNILSLLSLADLGFETVLMYTLYKPIAEKDHEFICELINSFKKLYRIIAITILILGLSLIPFLSNIIRNSGLSNKELIFYYIFFLMNSVCSYLMVYKSALLQADQNVHIVKLVKAFSQMICGIAQIILIIVFRNYIAYLFTMLATTLINNIILNYKANKEYSFLNEYEIKGLSNDIKAKLISNTKSVFLYKIGTTIVNSTDNIFISIILGAAMVGFYSNYYTIVFAITAIIGILNSALIPSIGNYITLNTDADKRQDLFYTVIIIYFFIATVASSILVLNIDQFIGLWVGNKFILNRNSVLIIVLYFYFQCIAHPMWMFRETSGLFKEIRICILSMAGLNIILSYVLGKNFGISGIIGATLISRILTLFWYEPTLLSKAILQCSVRNYWFRWGRDFLISSFTISILVILFDNKFLSLKGMFIKSIICIIFTIFVFVISLSKTKEFKIIYNKFIKR